MRAVLILTGKELALLQFVFYQDVRRPIVPLQDTSEGIELLDTVLIFHNLRCTATALTCSTKTGCSIAKWSTVLVDESRDVSGGKAEKLTTVQY